jgi:hypothetical protein
MNDLEEKAHDLGVDLELAQDELKEAKDRIEVLEGIVETMRTALDNFGDRANNLAHDLWSASKEEY